MPRSFIIQPDQEEDFERPHAQVNLMERQRAAKLRLSYEQRQTRMRQQIQAQLRKLPSPDGASDPYAEKSAYSVQESTNWYPYIKDTFDDSVVVESNGRCWRVPFSEDEYGNFEIGDELEEVVQVYAPVGRKIEENDYRGR